MLRLVFCPQACLAVGRSQRTGMEEQHLQPQLCSVLFPMRLPPASGGGWDRTSRKTRVSSGQQGDPGHPEQMELNSGLRRQEYAFEIPHCIFLWAPAEGEASSSETGAGAQKDLLENLNLDL